MGVTEVMAGEPGTVDLDPAARIARAGLLRVAEPPAPALAAFVTELGAVAAFDAVIRRDGPPEVMATTRARTAGRSATELREHAEHDLEVAAGRGAELVYPEHPGWPVAAMTGFTTAMNRGVQGAAPPLALYIRGALPDDLPSAAVTLVGARASTGYGNRVAADISAGLIGAGLSVVSGGAFGIDTAAHRAALGSGGRSVAVLACGIDRSYPVANAGLLARLTENGALVSEYPPGTTPAKHRFLVRNRVLAALAAVTVVVEAGRRSGALSTASAAAHLGRVVMAVPGPVTSAMSVGCHLLLRDRFAILAAGVEDVLAVVRPLGQPADQQVGERRPTDGLGTTALRVHDALPARSSRSVYQLSVESGVEDGLVLEALVDLELCGLVRHEGGRWSRRPA